MSTIRYRIIHVTIITLLVAVFALSCTRPGSESTPTLRLATTTSTEDSGLLEEILPDFEERYGASVDVVAVGTGQALTLGEQGDVDIVLVHAPQREERFIRDGFGVNRQDVMYNDFIIIGPESDFAGVRDAGNAVEAFAHIASSRSIFVSRGDQSGTHDKELSIWRNAGTAPEALTGWYQSLGQGMGETLITANEQRAYTFTDRATYLSMRDKLPELAILFGGETIDQNPDTSLRNPYGVIQVNPEKHPGVNAELAATFIQWLTSPDVQARIGKFGIEQHGQPLFLPVAAP
jgi:tungstate transport system substrate-binding protein